MTGPEHYQEAERLLKNVDEGGADPDSMLFIRARLARAQVHATLALVAATRPDVARPEVRPTPTAYELVYGGAADAPAGVTG